MKGTTHRLLGAATGVALGSAAGWAWPQIVASGWLATLTASGPTSPDVDQHRLWYKLDKILPDELLGNNGPMQHRGLAHWWGLPASAGALVWATVPGEHQWILWSLLAGWISHLIGDYLFGRAGQGRGPGIPFAPWWNHRGLGLAVGGWLENTVAVLLPFLMLVQGFLVVRAVQAPGAVVEQAVPVPSVTTTPVISEPAPRTSSARTPAARPPTVRTPATPTPTKPASTKPASTKPASTKPTAAKQTPAKQTPAKQAAP